MYAATVCEFPPVGLIKVFLFIDWYFLVASGKTFFFLIYAMLESNPASMLLLFLCVFSVIDCFLEHLWGCNKNLVTNYNKRGNSEKIHFTWSCLLEINSIYRERSLPVIYTWRKVAPFKHFKQISWKAIIFAFPLPMHFK